MDAKNLYHHTLLEHYKNPRNTGLIENPHFSSGQVLPSCGDQIIVEGTIEHNSLITVSMRAKGCVIVTATASLLSELVKNKSLSEIQALQWQDVQKLTGLPSTSLRLNCALLPLKALQKGLKK